MSELIRCDKCGYQGFPKDFRQTTRGNKCYYICPNCDSLKEIGQFLGDKDQNQSGAS